LSFHPGPEASAPKKKYVECKSAAEVVEAIKQMKIRGAPAIGLAAAYALVLEAGRLKGLPWPEFILKLEEAKEELASTRPTAVNLFML